jgi:hypothetical protein
VQQRRHLEVLYPEGDGDHVTTEASVPEPDRNGMNIRQLPDGRRSIHVSKGKYAEDWNLRYSLLRFTGLTTQKR